MSYSDDICYEEFTPGQIVRMEAAWEYFRTGSKAPACTKLCNLMIPAYFPNLGLCRKAMCKKGNVKGDSCTKATKLKLGTSVSGSTVFAEPDNAPSCQGVDNVSGGVWYRIRGNGGIYRASTCGFTTLLMDSQISVYKNGCGSLECVAANANSPSCSDFRSEVTFLTTAGTEYLILVHGFGFEGFFTTEGAFDLVVNEVGVPTELFSLFPIRSCAQESHTFFRFLEEAATVQRSFLVVRIFRARQRCVPSSLSVATWAGTFSASRRRAPSAMSRPQPQLCVRRVMSQPATS
jgi:hypothetical protein